MLKSVELEKVNIAAVKMFYGFILSPKLFLFGLFNFIFIFICKGPSENITQRTYKLAGFYGILVRFLLS